MNTKTSMKPIRPVHVPMAMASAPRSAPTVRSSITVSGAGRAPARSRVERSVASCAEKRPLICPEPPTIGSRRLKVVYVTQAEVAPPTFVFFVNDPALVHFSYERYIENRLRDAFDFEGTAIRIVFRRRSEDRHEVGR